MKHVEIFTDGACKGNPGPGGWGAIIRMGEHEKELSGSDPATTNNRMELMGAIKALAALKQPCAVKLPIRLSASTTALFSTPSAVIGRPSPSPSEVIASTMVALSRLPGIAVTKLRSILIRSNGSVRSCASEL